MDIILNSIGRLLPHMSGFLYVSHWHVSIEVQMTLLFCTVPKYMELGLA